MMNKSYSIAEARNRFTAILRDVEKAPAVEITRHGEPVAVLLSWREYQRLASKKNYWEAYRSFRDQFDLMELEIEPEIFSESRDRSSGREVSL
jgi:prevent-host-death family protein